MALDTFVAGRYSGTYNAVDVGITDDGYTLQQDLSVEAIDESDAYGGTLIDFIYRGGNAFLRFMSKAYKAGSISPLWPYGALGVGATAAAPIGRLASAIAAAMVLTSTANTPAAAAPASLTGPGSILAPNFSWELLYNSKLRRVPVRLQLLPYLDTGTLRWFALT